mmetsp:Transcript_40832/g.102157  ORF Transcript_40832/g.102157 Transcript_40832/m.102157 type:complete len:80 (+) Transcript_40832:3-242(+)
MLGMSTELQEEMARGMRERIKHQKGGVSADAGTAAPTDFGAVVPADAVVIAPTDDGVIFPTDDGEAGEDGTPVSRRWLI